MSAVDTYVKELGKSINLTTEQILHKVNDFSDRKTKIICTMGPSCWSVSKLVEMIDAGLNVARLNFSHGDHETHGRTVENLREALKQRPGKHVSIMLDTKGPEIRTGMLKNGEPVTLKAGQELKIVTDYDLLGDNTFFACSYKKLPQSVKVGGTILVADGTITLHVKSIGSDFIITTVLNNAVLGERKNMNLPNVRVELPVCGEKETHDILNFGIPYNCDMIAASFTQCAEDVRYIRKVLGEKGKHIKIIPKIENVEGIVNFDEILAESDGIMVARGDMGMEIPPEKVFLAQKMMIAKCNIAGKPVITATQMLESMIKNPRPTRAEASDVANAVLDGSDCVMLSGESAGGAFPIEAVNVLVKTCFEAEACLNYTTLFKALIAAVPKPVHQAEILCRNAVEKATICNASLIVCAVNDPQVPKWVAKYRPIQNIVSISPCERFLREMQLHRGITPLSCPPCDKKVTVDCIRTLLNKSGIIKTASKIILITGNTDELNVDVVVA
jgi:pyruvate kinase